uniref:Uncharacterized protein n=1 Tax=Cyanothece sp. (strain PCC 7425 / ATCC 29141) TaxID=395961 RepID=B8HNE0_CYAP4
MEEKFVQAMVELADQVASGNGGRQTWVEQTFGPEN